jgi:DNA-binding MarR family transcriptional regulator
MKVAEKIKRALEHKGLRTRKEAAKALGISSELLRITVYRGHIPKDSVLGKIADKLGLDRTELILAAHKEKVPIEAKGYFLSAARRKSYPRKRVWPLSEEQCDHLARVLDETEIQIIRMFRQIPDEAKSQIVGYLSFTWATKRMTREAVEEKGKGKGEGG